MDGGLAFFEPAFGDDFKVEGLLLRFSGGAARLAGLAIE